ncbi:MAG TPA: hypothetical protein VGL68_00475 [Solirubrobacteraceae bacterium]|jgi:hypothetical protein
MRLRKLVPASLAAASLLALAPAAALAHKHPGPLGHCRIDIASISPDPITAGEATEISGRLTCGRVPAAGQTVQLYAHLAGTAGFIPVQSTTTEAGGAYKFSTAAEDTNVSFYVRSLGAQSGRRRLKVAAQVTIAGPPEGTQIETGAPHRETFSGTVTPGTDVGARVILQRQNAINGEEWHRIGVGQVMEDGTYSITHVFRVPGDASIRVLVRSDGLNIPSASTPLEYEISQAQNPNLTISSSADPIGYGQSVTISGVVAGATAGRQVTLLARTVHQHGFAPVAEATTDASGNYSFAAQTPVNSTLYRVISADLSCPPSSHADVRACKGHQLKSAVLYEGVKDVLTAEVSATTIQAGQALEFKGTVAPDHTGHVIYLEREDATGSGFHVVQVGHVLPGSTYTIVHQVYVPGTKVFRIEIPGGPDNGRAVSQLFTVQVKPAPASALTPESPGNSSMPGEGTTTGSEAETPLGE